MGGLGDDTLDQSTTPRPPAQVRARGKLLPPMSGMEATILNMPVLRMKAAVIRGWWRVEVQVEPMGLYYTGKQDRSYFSALAKSLDAAMKATHY